MQCLDDVSFASQNACVRIVRNGIREEAKVMQIVDSWSWDDFLFAASERLRMVPAATRAFNAHGAELHDLALIAEDEIVILSAGEPFRLPPSEATANTPLSVGGYRLTRFLGRGGFGEVQLGEHAVTGERVALKFLSKSLLGGGRAAERIATEIHCLSALHHPHIIRLDRVVSDELRIVLVFEFAACGDLREYLLTREQTRLAEGEARTVMRQVLAAVAYAHNANIIHRDLKLENILLTKDAGTCGLQNAVKVADFGLSAFFRHGDELVTRCGSPSYLAPELFRGEACEGPPIDVWCMGVILFALLCGRLPFEGSDLRGKDRPAADEVRRRIAQGDFTVSAHVSPEARALIHRMLTVDPSKRMTIPELHGHPWIRADAAGIVVADAEKGAQLTHVEDPSTDGALQRPSPATASSNGHEADSDPSPPLQSPPPAAVAAAAAAIISPTRAAQHQQVETQRGREVGDAPHAAPRIMSARGAHGGGRPRTSTRHRRLSRGAGAISPPRRERPLEEPCAVGDKRRGSVVRDRSNSACQEDAMLARMLMGRPAPATSRGRQMGKNDPLWGDHTRQPHGSNGYSKERGEEKKKRGSSSSSSSKINSYPLLEGIGSCKTPQVDDDPSSGPPSPPSAPVAVPEMVACGSEGDHHPGAEGQSGDGTRIPRRRSDRAAHATADTAPHTVPGPRCAGDETRAHATGDDKAVAADASEDHAHNHRSDSSARFGGGPRRPRPQSALVTTNAAHSQLAAEARATLSRSPSHETAAAPASEAAAAAAAAATVADMAPPVDSPSRGSIRCSGRSSPPRGGGGLVAVCADRLPAVDGPSGRVRAMSRRSSVGSDHYHPLLRPGATASPVLASRGTLRRSSVDTASSERLRAATLRAGFADEDHPGQRRGRPRAATLRAGSADEDHPGQRRGRPRAATGDVALASSLLSSPVVSAVGDCGGRAGPSLSPLPPANPGAPSPTQTSQLPQPSPPPLQSSQAPNKSSPHRPRRHRRHRSVHRRRRSSAKGGGSAGPGTSDGTHTHGPTGASGSTNAQQRGSSGGGTQVPLRPPPPPPAPAPAPAGGGGVSDHEGPRTVTFPTAGSRRGGVIHVAGRTNSGSSRESVASFVVGHDGHLAVGSGTMLVRRHSVHDPHAAESHTQGAASASPPQQQQRAQGLGGWGGTEGTRPSPLALPPARGSRRASALVSVAGGSGSGLSLRGRSPPQGQRAAVSPTIPPRLQTAHRTGRLVVDARTAWRSRGGGGGGGGEGETTTSDALDAAMASVGSPTSNGS